MATLDDDRAGAAPWILSAPALLLFCGLLLVPLLLTFVLSFHVFSDTAGTLATYTWRNYFEVITDPYYGAIFGRTAALAFAVTFFCILLGVPETIVLARMKRPWQSICLLIVLGPLLISVVVRTLGWQILLGNNGVLNNALQALHITSEPIRLVFTMTGVIIALTHVLVPFMVMSVWATLQKLDPQVEWAGLSMGASPFRVFRRVVLPQILPGILSGSIIVFALSALVDDGVLLNLMIGNGPAGDPETIAASFNPLAVLVAMACYIPVAMLFWFAPVLVAWHDVPPAKALFFSFVGCWRNRGAFVLYGALWIGVALAVSFGLSALMQVLGVGQEMALAVLMPASILVTSALYCSFYATYRGCFGLQSEDPADDIPDLSGPTA